ncbi:MAG TPA: FAD binding domain-containing protein, partial [Anaerolineales bacterium]|nr:FAD binding domain-containing protein [Anaerolineales bacterium]
MAPNAYYQPQSVDSALDLIAQHGPSLLIIAGGTLAMPLINDGVSFPDAVLSLRHTGLDYIRSEEGYVALGAAVRMSQVIAWDGIPMLSQAARQIGGWAIRNMATAGGNLFAPPPAGDFAVALLALDARLRIVSPSGERKLPLRDFYTGFMTTALAPAELVTEIQVPWPEGRTAYTKVGRRHANTPAIVT